MLLIEFSPDVQPTRNMVRYRDAHRDQWHYMEMDIETLSLLISNYGLISIRRMPTQAIQCDNGTLSTTVHVNYCGAKIELGSCFQSCPLVSDRDLLTQLELSH